MSLKKRTFKQRARKNEMKERHKVSSDLRKRMQASRRRHNRFDNVDCGSRPLTELVEDISTGSAAPTREVTFDPRSLTDLLLSCSTSSPLSSSVGVAVSESGNDSKKRLALPEAPLPDDHPLAIPEVHMETNEKKGENDGSLKKVKNQYRHHGDPYLFWERVGLHPLLLKALRSMRFTHPTPVQDEVLGSILPKNAVDVEGMPSGAKSVNKAARKQRECRKDVVISAETGSGKTLAFALPILQHILTKMKLHNDDSLDAETADHTGSDERENEKGSGTERAQRSDGMRKGRKSSLSEEIKMSGKLKRKRPREEEEVDHAVRTVRTVPADQLMQALIVSPTRELALQINEAMLQLTQHAQHIVIGCVVGGMAPEKQQRVLNRHPHVLICTPGRLWDLVQKNEGCYLGHSISRRLSFVVLDEADKLLQSGRFEDLKSLLERIHCEMLPAGFAQEREEGAEVNDMKLEAGRWDEKTQTFIPNTKHHSIEKKTMMSTEEVEDANNDDDETVQKSHQRLQRRKDNPRPIPMPPNPPDGHRVITFVTSATLSLQTNYERRDVRSKKTVIRTSNSDTMMTVLQQLEIKPTNAHVFTISPKADVAAKIRETYLRCPGDSKDLYLYYFLKMYHERTIVFVNAISMLRRLVKLLEVLGIPVVGLHASLQQRQRLKFIDKFRRGEKCVLVATDIASRGLDVEGLKYVIHFQVPRSTDGYIHRCGRTARCGGTGLSVLMVNAQEHVSFTKLIASLGRLSSEMEVFALQPTIVHQLHPHIKVALQIDKLQKEIDKSRARNNWALHVSREADIDVDDMVDDEVDIENKSKEKAINLLKKKLALLIQKDMGRAGGKGGFRASAQALGAKNAESRIIERATTQVTQQSREKLKTKVR